MIEFVKNNKINIIFLAVYLIITAVSLCFHEIWRDEAQAWCIARDLNFIDIYKTARIEGHPALWHLLLAPFAKLGFPVISMQILSLIFSAAAVYIILFKSAFNYIEKFFIIFGAGMLYYMPVIARSYSLIPVILFLAALFWRKKTEHAGKIAVLITLLMNTHLYMLGLSFALFIVFLFETAKDYYEKRKLKPLLWALLPAFSFLFIFLTFYGASGQNSLYAMNADNKMNIKDFILLISRVFVHPVFANYKFPVILYDIIAAVLSVFGFAAAVFGFFKTDKKVCFIYSFASLFILGVFYKCWIGGVLYQKVYMLMLIGIFCFMLVKSNKDKISKALCCSFYAVMSAGLLVSPYVIAADLKYNFSGAKQISAYIKENLNEAETFIVLGNPYLYAAISAYLPDKKLYDLRTQSYISFYTYNLNEKKKNEPLPGTLYSIADDEIPIDANENFTVLFQTNKENISSKAPKEIFKLCILNQKQKQGSK